MWPAPAATRVAAMSTPKLTTTTTAYVIQAVLSFSLALTAILFGIVYLDIDPWVRAFLALAVLFLTTSSFTLAKCIRDQQESHAITQRLDQARVDKILSEHDPFQNPV
jgi:hypothetical protein